MRKVIKVLIMTVLITFVKQISILIAARNDLLP
jgi:hypothetical protein